MAYGSDERGVQEQQEAGGVDRRRAMRLGVLGLVIVVAVVFMAQNNDRVELNFLVVGIETRLWVGLLATLLLGAVLGQAAETLWRRRRRRGEGS